MLDVAQMIVFGVIIFQEFYARCCLDDYFGVHTPCRIIFPFRRTYSYIVPQNPKPDSFTLQPESVHSSEMSENVIKNNEDTHLNFTQISQYSAIDCSTVQYCLAAAVMRAQQWKQSFVYWKDLSSNLLGMSKKKLGKLYLGYSLAWPRDLNHLPFECKPGLLSPNYLVQVTRHAS